MSYNEKLAEKVRIVLLGRRPVTEKQMFGGLAFLIDGKMFCGVIKDDLMVRVGLDRYQEALEQAHVRPMDFTGRPMRGYVYVAPPGLRSRTAIARWIDQAIEFVSSLTSPKPRNI